MLQAFQAQIHPTSTRHEICKYEAVLSRVCYRHQLQIYSRRYSRVALTDNVDPRTIAVDNQSRIVKCK
jgi:hypothetical protein